MSERAVAVPLVALFTGAPGTGKSTLADAIGRELGAPVYAWDWCMAPIRQVKPVFDVVMALPPVERWSLGYSLIEQLVEKQLRNGQSALVDCVARLRVEQRFAAAAARHDASFSVIECTCDDEALHRQRVEGRVRAIPGWYELDWADVKRTRDSYEPVTCAKLVVDAGAPLDRNLERVRAHLGLGKDATTATGSTR